MVLKAIKLLGKQNFNNNTYEGEKSVASDFATLHGQ